MPPGVRQGGGFAKRNAASSKLSRKIGWLNNTGSLQQEIRFSDVKDLLQKVGDDDAMQILKNLEKKAKEIQNPTGYISNSAKNCLDGGRRQRSRTQRGRQGPVPEPEEPPKDRWRDAEAEEPQDSSHDGDAPMADQEPDDWNEDVNLEEDADGKEDTEPADVQQLEDQMRMLNSNAGLNQVSSALGADYAGWDAFAVLTLGIPVALAVSWHSRGWSKILFVLATSILGALVAVNAASAISMCAHRQIPFGGAPAVLLVAALGALVQWFLD